MRTLKHFGLPNRQWRQWLPLIAILCIQGACLIWNAYRSSPVHDEFGHFYAGLCYHKYGNQELFCVNPPFIRAIGTWPGSVTKLASEVTVPDLDNLARSEFGYGRFLFRDEPILFQRSLFLGRLLVSPFALLGTLVCFLWARRLGGQVAAVIVACLWAFQPQVIAHGSLITNDVAVASMMLASVYVLSDWLRKPSIRQTLLCGVTLGFALLCKFTALLLLPIFVIGFMLTIKRPLTSGVLRFSLLLWVAWVVLCAGYGFRGVGTRLGDYEFVSHWLSDTVEEVDQLRSNRFRDTVLAPLPIPLPKYFVLGMDQQQLDFETGLMSYVLGTHKNGSWWWFLLFSMLVKLPVGTLVAIAIGAVLMLPRIRRFTLDQWLVVAMAFVVIETTAIKDGIGQQVRYILPLYPYLLILIAAALKDCQWRSWAQRIATVCCVATIIESAWVAPHWMSSFNFIAGGSQAGYRYLFNDATDWGQSLYDIADWANQHPEKRPLLIASSNSTAFDCYGQNRFHGDVVISNDLCPENGWILISQHDRTFPQWSKLNDLEPLECVAGSHLVYYVEGTGEAVSQQDRSQ